MRWTYISKALSFLQITAEHQDCPVFKTIETDIPKYLDNCQYRFRLNFTNIEAIIGGKSSREKFWKNSSQCRETWLQVK